MFGTRRLAKRSIIGTRVCAPFGRDGRFYEQGVIQSTLAWPNGEEVYTVSFTDGSTRTMRDRDIVGTGFQTVASTQLAHGQRVYITFSGREVCGSIYRSTPSTSSSSDTDDLSDGTRTRYVVVQVISDGKEVRVRRRLEDVRLLPSRKSARLKDQGDTDYNKLTETGVTDVPKKRTVSHVIDVPAAPAAKYSRRRKSDSPPLDGCLGLSGDAGSMGLSGDTEAAVMDEHMAALVLTSLSCSPASPSYTPLAHDKAGGPSDSPLMFGCSVGSSGVWGGKCSPLTPSPPSQVSHSAPISTVFGASPVDEGIVLDETRSYFMAESENKKKDEVASFRTVYRCTWPGCDKIYNTCAAIETHVRTEHLGPTEHNDSDVSDHEEEFYYTEIAVNVDTMTQSFAEMHTSTPPRHHPVDACKATMPLDHDYQKKEVKSSPQSIPQVNVPSDPQPQGTSLPVAVTLGVTPLGGLNRSFSWQTPSQMSQRVSKVHDRLYQHQSQSPKSHHFFPTSPKTSSSSSSHKKSRSDVKKCRKVYGMENRELWCTQCKWKKACSRFME